MCPKTSSPLVVLVAVSLSAVALAQPGLPGGDRAPRPGRSGPRFGPPQSDRPATCPGAVPDRPGWPGGRWGPGTGLEPYFFRLSPEDRRPLAPGEDEELLEFARRELPRLYELLEHLRMRDPGRFPQRLAEHAPRLRHFRRIHELSPQLAGIVRDHADNAFKLQRAARRAHHAAPDSPQRAEIIQTMRSLVMANLELEIRAADLLAELLDQHRDARVAERTAALLAGESPAPEEPAALATLLEEYRMAAGEAERATIRSQIEGLLSKQAEHETAALRERAARLRETLAEQCEQSLMHLLERVDRPPRPRGGRLGPPPGEPGQFAP